MEMASFGAPRDDHFGSKCTHAGQEPEQWNSMAVVPPISMATTYKQDGPAEYQKQSGKKYEYGRSGNPTRECLEACIASLDGASTTVCFSSGLAATDNVVKSLLAAGDHMVCMDDIYGGTNRYFRQIASKMGIEVSFVDMRTPENASAALKPNTKLVWIETPTNPTLKIVDIKAVSDLVHQQDGVHVLVDNTFLSAYFCRPLELGADLTYYSLTKYMNGHSDVIMGAVSTNKVDLGQKLRWTQNCAGAIPSPFDCYLVNRSLKTLHVRMEQHQKNANALAKFLESSPYVEKVLHPGSPSHPQHEVVLRQQSGHSGMLSFYIKGNLENSRKFLKALKLVTLAESLGGFESLAELPYLMTHASIAEKERVALGITDNFIRFSAGLETTQDLIDDVKNALEAAQN